jgi:PAS domain S-box-containing protein
MPGAPPPAAALLHASPVALAGLAADGTILSWNEAARGLFGYAGTEVEGRPLAMLLQGEPEEAAQLLRQAAEEGLARVGCLARGRDGETLEIELALAPLRGAAGETAGFCATFHRPTAPRRTLERLYQSEERYRLIVESALDFAIFTMDLEGRLSSWNAGARRLLGYAPEEVIGKHGRIIFVPEDQAAGVPERELEGALRQGVHENERWHLRSDGERLWGSGLVMLLRSAQGEVQGFLKILRDHTHRRVAEERLAKTMSQLLHSNELLERFAYVASHDLQEPIRTIRSFAQLLARRYQGRLDADADEFLGYIAEGAERLEGRVRGLLQRARASRIGGTPARVSLEEVLQTVLLDLRAHVRATHAKISHEPLPEVRGDALLYSQVLQNLLSNALKFSGDQAPAVHVWAEEEKGNGSWRVSVRDSGAGVDPADAERIFGLFERGVEAAAGGTGVGLAICKRIVEMQGGRIWVESRPGEGATFHFTAPRA